MWKDNTHSWLSFCSWIKSMGDFNTHECPLSSGALPLRDGSTLYNLSSKKTTALLHAKIRRIKEGDIPKLVYLKPNSRKSIEIRCFQGLCGFLLLCKSTDFRFKIYIFCILFSDLGEGLFFIFVFSFSGLLSSITGSSVPTITLGLAIPAIAILLTA